MSTLQSILSRIRLAERVPNSDGAVFATLHTIAELEEFWHLQCFGLQYAAQGILIGDQQYFLDEYEWVFAPSKAALIKAVTRWDAIGITCEWYDWALLEPERHAAWFEERAQFREDRRSNGRWTAADEVKFQQDSRLRSPETYRGYWTLNNLPPGCTFADWFTSSRAEVIDSTLSAEMAAALLQEMTFDDWHDANIFNLALHDAMGVEHEIMKAKAQRNAGDDYYGCENEAFLAYAH
jgi:hypothetical protein